MAQYIDLTGDSILGAFRHGSYVMLFLATPAGFEAFSDARKAGPAITADYISETVIDCRGDLSKVNHDGNGGLPSAIMFAYAEDAPITITPDQFFLIERA